MLEQETISKERITIYARRLVLFGFGAIFIVISTVLVSQLLNYSYNDFLVGTYWTKLFFVVLFFFFVCSVSYAGYVFYLFFKNPIYLEATTDHLYLKNVGIIKWDEIVYIDIVEIDNGESEPKHLHFGLKDNKNYYINAEILSCKPEELHEILVGFLKKRAPQN
jgi:hypothetical protein